MSSAIILNSNQHECLKEITEGAMKQTSKHLAQLLHTDVSMSNANIAVISPAEVAMALKSLNDEKVNGLCQGFIGGGLSGEVMLLFNDISFPDLARFMEYDKTLDARAERELLMDTTNILSGSILRGIAIQMDIHLSYDPPTILKPEQELYKPLESDSVRWSESLGLEVSYSTKGGEFQCDILAVFCQSTLPALYEKLKYMVD